MKRPSDVGMVAALRLMVDPGESEAIVLAYEKGLRIILDDRKAREVAQRLGVHVTGTVGLIIKAKQEGVIAEVRPLLDTLDANHFRPGHRRESIPALAGRAWSHRKANPSWKT